MADRNDWEARNRWDDERRNRMAGDDHSRSDYSGEFARDRWGRSGTTGASTPRNDQGRGYQSRENQIGSHMRGDRRTHDWEVGDRSYSGEVDTYGRSRWQDPRGNRSTGNPDWFTSEDYGQGVGSWGGRSRHTPGGAGYSGRGPYRNDDPRGFVDKAVDEVRSWFGDEEAEHRREEDHRGRGPSDYTRSDERIREDANDRLTEHPLIDARQVSVTVDEGEITLSGTVRSRIEKRRAEDCVEDVSGVKHVQNNLRISTGGAADNLENSGGATIGWGGGTAKSTG